MYYKIRLSFDHDEEGCAWVEEYINVNSRQEAEECIPQIAKDYKITGIPRFMVFGKDGQVVEANAPRPSAPELKELLEAELKK